MNPFKLSATALTLSLSFAGLPLAAASFSWGSPTTGGSWSVPANWQTGGGTASVAPTTADTVLLDTATANRDVIYDSSASGNLTSLSYNQTSAFLNELEIEKNFTIGNGVATTLTLGASAGGTSEFFVDALTPLNTGMTVKLGSGGATGSATAPGATDGQIIINSGGLLEASSYAAGGNGGGYTINSDITISGGTLNAELGTSTTSAGKYYDKDQINGLLTMTSGTLSLGSAIVNTTGLNTTYFPNTVGTSTRFSVNGNLNITGGTILAPNGGAFALWLYGNNNVINPTSTFPTAVPIILQGLYTTAGTAESLTTNTALGGVTIYANGNSSVAYFKLASTANIGAVSITDSTINGATILLGGNLTSGAVGISGFNTPATSGTLPLTLDTNGANTWDMTAGGIFTPGNSFGANAAPVNTVWTLQNSGSGTGVFKATGFNFTATPSLAANISAGATNQVVTTGTGSLTLQATSNTAATNVFALGANTVIGSNTTLLYSGTNTLANAATLTAASGYTLNGTIAVQNGALTLTQGALTQINAGAANVSSGGTLDLNGSSVGKLALNSGGAFTVSTGVLSLTLNTTGFDQITGTGTLSLSGLTLNINGNGLASSTYQVWSGFTGFGGLSNITVTGSDANLTGMVGSIDSTGLLSFSAVPEPATWVLLAAGSLGLVALRRLRRA